MAMQTDLGDLNITLIQGRWALVEGGSVVRCCAPRWRHGYLVLKCFKTSNTCKQHACSRSPDSRRPGVQLIFLCLLVPRLLSALFNIIHDCDEVFNYWEPLHFLLYGHGMQTWEYRHVPLLPSASPSPT